MANEPVVDVFGSQECYGDITALNRVDLRVWSGTTHGLLGPDGAGKTMLLSALFGLVLPDELTVGLLARTRADAGGGWLNGVRGSSRDLSSIPV